MKAIPITVGKNERLKICTFSVHETVKEFEHSKTIFFVLNKQFTNATMIDTRKPLEKITSLIKENVTSSIWFPLIIT